MGTTSSPRRDHSRVGPTAPPRIATELGGPTTASRPKWRIGMARCGCAFETMRINRYALQISPADLKLFRVADGADTQLGATLPYAYPVDEYLFVDVRIVGDACRPLSMVSPFSAASTVARLLGSYGKARSRCMS